ncbi:MAG: sigma-70 family RNA polymerase sigma factor [Abitibacteriaceae bacterium]|nr:sigma-70 family RNA polymerase sigma factor [Abditibacteriaceae bacterium]
MSTTLTTRWQNNARGAKPLSPMPKAPTPRPVSNAPVTSASASRSKARRNEDGRAAVAQDAVAPDAADTLTDDNITDEETTAAPDTDAATETLNSDEAAEVAGADEVDTAPAIAAAPPDPARAQFLQTLQRAKEGDLKAFEEIFQLYHRRIYNAVYGMLGDPDDAQDVTQDVFMRLHDALPTLRADEAFSTYLYRIALNLCRDRARRKKRVRFQSMDTPRTDESGESEPMEFPDLAKLPEETITNEELQKRVREAVQTLSEDHKAVIMMHHFQGMEVNDIARILHVPTGTVKSRLARGRDQLHRKLRSYLNM